jgi:hypothetical protein
MTHDVSGLHLQAFYDAGDEGRRGGSKIHVKTHSVVQVLGLAFMLLM